MLQVIKPPTNLSVLSPNDWERSIFLGGSIDMGNAEPWREQLLQICADLHIDNYYLNPWRDNWDSSWEQSIDNPFFREQVEWELEAMERAKLILLYFQPGTMAPISLLELGLFTQTRKVVVFCPDGYERKGNVDVVCRRYNLTQVLDWQSVVGLFQQTYQQAKEVIRKRQERAAVAAAQQEVDRLNRQLDTDYSAGGFPSAG